ncbi:MAG: hypothetical protein JRH07_07145 [Deltaproteobacteria bacterium]|nr:hypothetical protein [Deltaproteobacteria bacterium]MBW2121606.1 hypothetical protein [Deltaproteobacteria bacterium]
MKNTDRKVNFPAFGVLLIMVFAAASTAPAAGAEAPRPSSLQSQVPKFQVHPESGRPIYFPEFQVRPVIKLPNIYKPAPGVDLRAYFTRASYNPRTARLTLQVAVTNFGDTPCKKTFRITVKPMLSIGQTLYKEYRDYKQRRLYEREFIAVGPPKKAVSLGPGKTLYYGLTYDMRPPELWAARGVRVEADPDKVVSQVGPWTNDYAYLKIRPDDFDYSPVIVAHRGSLKDAGGSFHPMELAVFQNMGVNALQLEGIKIESRFYSKRIEAEALKHNPRKFAGYEIKRGYRYCVLPRRYLKRGETRAYSPQVLPEVWRQVRTVYVIFDPDKKCKLKYRFMASLAFQR